MPGDVQKADVRDDIPKMTLPAMIATDVDGTVEARKVMFGGERDEVRARAAQAALFLLRRALTG